MSVTHKSEAGRLVCWVESGSRLREGEMRCPHRRERGGGGRRGKEGYVDKGPQVLIAYANCFHSSRPATSPSEPQNAG